MLQPIHVERTVSDERVQLVPGIEGPKWVTARLLTGSRAGGLVEIGMRIEHDYGERGYVCTEFNVHRIPESMGFVTSETLRKPAVADLIATNVFLLRSEGEMRELPNPDNVEPWGWSAPPGLIMEGPTDRALRWVAHLYHYGLAISMTPAKVVETTLKLPHGTTARWIRQARERGYLGPAEGPGRAAG